MEEEEKLYCAILLNLNRMIRMKKALKLTMSEKSKLNSQNRKKKIRLGRRTRLIQVLQVPLQKRNFKTLMLHSRAPLLTKIINFKQWSNINKM